MSVDPRRQRPRETRVFDEFAVVPEATLPVEADGTFARPALGRGRTKKLGMMGRLHGVP
jgi:hypothetical protein